MRLCKLRCSSWCIALMIVLAQVTGLSAEESPLRAEAASALARAIKFYRTEVAVHGGYVYHTSLDLQQRWGEGVASKTQIWVQPPGTPAVGMAYLKAYQATRDLVYLAAARETAAALMYGQLKSGGWTNFVDFDPNSKSAGLYRNGKGHGKNNSTLDDGISTSAIRFLARLDQTLEFKDAAVHEAVQFALNALLAAQFPNGAFPQVWTGPVAQHDVVRANYPAYDWRTVGKVKNYWDLYTLNDNIAGDVADCLSEAWEIYRDPRYRRALAQLGDFLLLAQMPAPQPAWCQQYNYKMNPTWARKFEPPAISGSESQDVLRALLKIYAVTGDRSYLEPHTAALDYLEKSKLADGRLARYYELKTNKPLYMERQNGKYSLIYDDTNLPGHYGWKVTANLDSIRAQHQAALAGKTPPAKATKLADLEQKVRQILLAQDPEGRWIKTYREEKLIGQPEFPVGLEYLSSAVFNENVTSLSEYLLLTAPPAAAAPAADQTK